MGIESIGGATAGAASAVSTDIYLISGGVTLVEKTFEIGLYAFKTQSNSSTEASGTIEFRDASENVLNTLTLVDTDTGGTSSYYAGAIYLPQEATFMYYSGPSNVTGWLEMSYSASVGAKRIQSIITTTADYVLAYDATAYVFGGGGGAGGSGFAAAGGGGGGAGYLETGAVSAGTYNAVVGAGGQRSAEGTIIHDGLQGGTSSFGAVSAAGGFGGKGGTNTAVGGDGGSGGGGGKPQGTSTNTFGLGGVNGTNGGSTADAAGGIGSGVAFTGGFFLPTPAGQTGRSQAGLFYAGGNGGDGLENFTGQSASANSASGGGGASRASNGQAGGTGGSGVIYLVEA